VSDEQLQDEERQDAILRLLGETDSSTGVLILPTRRRGDIGVYDEGVDDLAKDLVRGGTVVSWADEPEQRRTIGKKSADQVVSAILSFPFGVAGNAAWFAIAEWLGLHDTRDCDLNFYRQTSRDGSTLTHLEYRGPASEIVELMRAAQLPVPPPSQADG
jgi:hypothetical protein